MGEATRRERDPQSGWRWFALWCLALAIAVTCFVIGTEGTTPRLLSGGIIGILVVGGVAVLQVRDSVFNRTGRRLPRHDPPPAEPAWPLFGNARRAAGGPRPRQQHPGAREQP